ncbi:MAG: hypothetical protein WC389_21735 [Lutibacter sp.]
MKILIGNYIVLIVGNKKHQNSYPKFINQKGSKMKRKDCPYYYENIPKDKLFIACIPLHRMNPCKNCARKDGWIDEFKKQEIMEK